MFVPRRRALPHHVPFWVDAQSEIYFVTGCCRVRRRNQLAIEPISTGLTESVAFRHTRRDWFAHLFLIMPDHWHALMSFPPDAPTVQKRISKWKEWTAKHLGIDWQRDFFEHRLRSSESRREKTDYILHNPVRWGLVERPEDWPYVWFPEEPRVMVP